MKRQTISCVGTLSRRLRCGEPGLEGPRDDLFEGLEGPLEPLDESPDLGHEGLVIRIEKHHVVSSRGADMKENGHEKSSPGEYFSGSEGAPR